MRSRTVYTPQLVLQGRDFREPHRFNEAVERINQTPARAQITLKVTPQSGTLQIVAKAFIADTSLRRGASLFIALYENNLQSDVTDGENAGRTLHHNFVVRKWIGPLAINHQGQLRWSQVVDLAEEWQAKDIGVVGCVLNTRNGDTLQAITLPLTD
jgi:hypothetical protein